jgi:hypothetical protein
MSLLRTNRRIRDSRANLYQYNCKSDNVLDEYLQGKRWLGCGPGGGFRGFMPISRPPVRREILASLTDTCSSVSWSSGRFSTPS